MNLSGLYVIIDQQVATIKDEVEVARRAIRGGARLIQLRDKSRQKGVLLPIAVALQQLCKEAGIPFIINDHIDLAIACEADGVHVGQKDLPVAFARRMMPSAIIGASTNNVEEALKAKADGASYVSVGRLFPTGSKQDTRPANLETLRAVKKAVGLPVCAIGGISLENIDSVIQAGADMAAVISAVVAARDVEKAARELARRF